MFRILVAAVLAGALAMVVPWDARAGVVDDATLASPGFYNGSGNPSSEFTIDTENVGGGTIELGLRARYRGGPDVTPVGNVYGFPSGSIAGHPTYALWNYDFSVNLEDSGLHISDILDHTTLTVKDLGTGVTVSINPFTHWVDDASYATGPTIYQNGTGAFVTSLLGAQNSENLGFGDSPLAGDFDPNVGDDYLFTLDVVKNDGTQLGSVTMQVNVPEPSTLLLLGTFLCLAPLLAWRRRSIGMA